VQSAASILKTADHPFEPERVHQWLGTAQVTVLHPERLRLPSLKKVVNVRTA
jgi:hypothetical protein